MFPKRRNAVGVRESFTTRGRGLVGDLLRRVPALASIPMGQVPESVHSRLLCAALNRILAPELAEGELDFLEDQCLAIRVVDLQARYRITLRNGRLEAAGSQAPDLTLSGDAEEFMLLASRREDPDTLFFQRRLHLDGNTELGLMVKNFLDALELDENRLPKAVLPLALAARRLSERFQPAANNHDTY